MWNNNLGNYKCFMFLFLADFSVLLGPVAALKNSCMFHSQLHTQRAASVNQISILPFFRIFYFFVARAIVVQISLVKSIKNLHFQNDKTTWVEYLHINGAFAIIATKLNNVSYSRWPRSHCNDFEVIR